MSNELSILAILNLAKACQYINTVRTGLNLALKGTDLDQKRARLIYMERVGIQRLYDLNPNDSTLRQTANYLFSLLRYESQGQQVITNQSGAIPVITGPANQSGLVGFTAVFSVSVISSSNVTFQWYNYLGNPIVGATSSSYSFVNAQLVDSGKTFFVKATNATGTAVSNTATLTVTESIVGQVYYGDTDYSADLLAEIDNITYNFTFPITPGDPFEIQFPESVNEKFIVIRYPNTEAYKTHYDNPPIDSGPIPGFALGNTSFGGNKYAFSHGGNTFTTNPPNLLTLS